MCREFDALRQSMLGYAAGFDALSLTPAQAADVVRIATQIEASVASIKALAVARAAEGAVWRQQGYRSAADHLAREAGMSPASAKRALDTGRRMQRQPEVAQAALAGQLSAEQATAVSDAVAAAPGKASELIDKARHSSMAELNEEVARTKAAVTDQEARRRARHSRRYFRRWTDRDGAMQAHMYGQPEDGVRMWRALDPICRRLMAAQKDVTDPDARDSLDALHYDAVVLLAAIAGGQDMDQLGLADLLELGLFPQLGAASLSGRFPPSGSTAGEPSPTGQPDLLSPPDGSPGQGGAQPSAKSGRRRAKRPARRLPGGPVRIIVRIDYDALLRGVPIEGEVCEIGGCPVPLSVIEDLMANDDAFLVGLLTKGQDVLHVHHFGRRYPNAFQRSALDWMYPSCAAAGCSARIWLQSDHREDWHRTRFTVLDLLDRLCVHHHNLKTRDNWSLVEGKGKRPFVPPDDPRHPRRRSGVAHAGSSPGAKPP